MSSNPSVAIGRVAALAASILAVSMVMIDQTIVAICGPAIEEGLHISHASLEWGINSYLLATAATFAFGGKWADHIGHKKVSIIGVSGFLVASVLCAVTPAGDSAATWFIVSRVLQGISGGLMFPAALGVVVAKVDPAKRGSAMAWFFAITGAMTAIGPMAGGYLATTEWRAIFLINVPIALGSIVMFAATSVPTERLAGRVDVLGAILVASGMTLTILGLQQWPSWEHTTALTVCAAGLAVLLVASVRMFRAATPLINLRRFADRGFLASAIADSISSFAFVPLFFFLSVYGQVSQGVSPTDSGLSMLKFFIGFVIGSRLGAPMFDRIGARMPIILGGLVGAAGFVWWGLTLSDLSIDGAAFVNAQMWPAILAGAGVGLMSTPASTDGVNRGDSTSYGEITGIFQTLRNFGAAFGLAVMSTVVTQQFGDKVTSGFAELGAPRGVAKCVADSVASGASCTSGGGQGGSPSAAFTHVVQLSYAEAAESAFWIMGVSMLLIAVVGWLLHPGDRVVLTATVSEVAPPEPARSETAASGRRTVGALLRGRGRQRRHTPRAARAALDPVQR